MMKRRTAILIVLIFWALAITGCRPNYPVHIHQIYSGLQRPLNQVALVIVPNPILPFDVDSQKLSVDALSRGGRTFEAIELTPGHHTIRVMYYKRVTRGSIYHTNVLTTTSKSRQIQINAEKGQLYLVRNTMEPNQFIPYIQKVGPTEFTTLDNQYTISLKKKNSGENDLFLTVEHDGKTRLYEVTRHDQLPRLGPEGKQMLFKTIYTPRQSQKFVLNGREGIEFDRYLTGTPLFSKDGGKCIYGAKIDEKWCLVVNHTPGKKYDDIAKNTIRISPDGQNVIYAAKSGDQWMMVLNEKESIPFDNYISGTPIFSPDSQTVVYGVKNKNKYRIVINDSSGKAYDGLGGKTIKISPDSSKIVYAAKSGERWKMVLNGRESTDFEAYLAGTPIFSPDSKKIVYGAFDNGKFQVFVNGLPGKSYENIGRPVFHPSGTILVYLASKLVDGQERKCIVTNGEEGKSYDHIENIVMNPFHPMFAYIAHKNGKSTVVVGDVEGKYYDEIKTGSLEFTEDRVVYKVKKGDKWVLNLDQVQ